MLDLETERWIRSPADQRAVERGCRFNRKKAEHVVAFCLELRHTLAEWAGLPLELLPWQRDELVMPLFGWEGPEGFRRYRTAYVEVPKKNGKSTLASALALYLLAADGEFGAQIYCAACDRDQASIVYREASRMALASPLLKAYVQPADSIKKLSLPSTGSFLRAISSDAFRAEGLNAHGVIFDEFHAQRSRELWDALRHAGAARRQPLTLCISTAGFDRHSVGYELHERALRVRDGIIEDDSFFPFIRAAELDEDWHSPEVWKKTNPSFGKTFSAEEFELAHREAADSPATENAFKRYRLNMWVEQEVRWLPMERWDACSRPIEAEALLGRACYAGLDLASTTDLAALVLVFPEPRDITEESHGEPSDASAVPCSQRYQVLPFFWAPAEGARKRERVHRVPYGLWARDGFLELTEGVVIDYDRIRKKIQELGELYQIRQIAIDRWNAQQIATQLQGDGFQVFFFGQGFASMSGPSKELEKLVLSKALSHGGHPVLRWMASNVSVETDAAGNLKPSRKRSLEKIDGIVALIMALGRATLESQAGSIYERQGVAWL